MQWSLANVCDNYNSVIVLLGYLFGATLFLHW